MTKTEIITEDNWMAANYMQTKVQKTIQKAERPKVQDLSRHRNNMTGQISRAEQSVEHCK